MKPVEWTPRAQRDSADAAFWYATQGGQPLGEAFLDEVEAAVRFIADFPAAGSAQHAAVFPDLPVPLRFHPLARFDRHLLYYLDLPDRILVIRIWHAARGLAALFDESAPGVVP